MDRVQTSQVLRDELAQALRLRERAVERFSKAMLDLPSGIPTQDDVERLQQASREHSLALRRSTDALIRLNDFLLNGTIPPELERKPPIKAQEASVAGESRVKTAGQG